MAVPPLSDPLSDLLPLLPALAQPAKARGGFGVLHLLLVALLAFLIGHFGNAALPIITEKLAALREAAAPAAEPAAEL